jgi:hypothetical protein
MTPKEKALEYVVTYYKIVPSRSKKESSELAKKLAIICVDEILKNFDGLDKPEYTAFDAIGERKFTFDGEYDTHMTGYDMEEYWKEVKREIKKI